MTRHGPKNWPTTSKLLILNRTPRRLWSAEGGWSWTSKSTRRWTSRGSFPPSTVKSGSPITRGALLSRRPWDAWTTRDPNSLTKACFKASISLRWGESAGNFSRMWSGQPALPAASHDKMLSPETSMVGRGGAGFVFGGEVGKLSQCLKTKSSIALMLSFWLLSRSPKYLTFGLVTPSKQRCTQALAYSQYLVWRFQAMLFLKK